VVHLCHSVCPKDLISWYASLCTRLDKLFIHIFAEQTDFIPRTRGFKRLRHEIVIRCKITQVGNHVCQEITTQPVFFTCLHTTILGRNTVNMLFLEGNFFLCAFEQECKCSHLGGIKAFDIDDIELLDIINEMLKSGSHFGLQRLPKLKLDVIHQTH